MLKRFALYLLSHFDPISHYRMLRRRSEGNGWVFASLGRGCMGNAANDEITLRAIQVCKLDTNPILIALNVVVCTDPNLVWSIGYLRINCHQIG